MGLFATERTIKIYFDENGNVTEKETPDWVEVLAELPYALHESFLKRMKTIVRPDGTYEVELGPLIFEPEFLAKVIKNWSANEAITVQNIRRLHSGLYEALCMKLRNLYNPPSAGNENAPSV